MAGALHLQCPSLTELAVHVQGDVMEELPQHTVAEAVVVQVHLHIAKVHSRQILVSVSPCCLHVRVWMQMRHDQMICRMQAREVFSRFWGPGRQAHSTPWQEQLSGHPSLAPLGHIHLNERHRTLTELRY